MRWVLPTGAGVLLFFGRPTFLGAEDEAGAEAAAFCSESARVSASSSSLRLWLAGAEEPVVAVAGADVGAGADLSAAPFKDDSGLVVSLIAVRANLALSDTGF